MIVDSAANDIVYSNLFTGVHGNYLKGSITRAGMNPAELPQSSAAAMSFSSEALSGQKAWKDIWGSGQGIGAVKQIQSAAAVVAQLKREYAEAKARLI
jgi:nitronate monooxygenase